MAQKKHIPLQNRLLESLERLGVLNAESSSPLVLMVSGGSDSAALARLLQVLAAQEGSPLATRPISVLHINHQLRGADADADEAFVRKLCSELSFNCVIKRFDVAAESTRTGESVEQAGRRLRYDAAYAVLNHSSNTSGCILTAHTADDRAETLLQRLIVGGGGSSLASIPERNGAIVRPLLACTREELRAWLRELNKPVEGKLWCEDATNNDTYYPRAYVRHELLPLLAARNPRIIESLNKTADVLATESAWMDEMALKLLPLTSTSFDAPLPLLRRAVYLACNEAIAKLAPEARITYDHIDLITQEGSKAGFACQIPGGIEVRNVRGTLTFSKAKPPQHDPRLSN